MQFARFKPRRKDRLGEDESARFEKIIEKMVNINEIYEKWKKE